MRSWAPVLGFAVLLVFQMVSLQQQIGELRTDLHREIGGLRDDLRTDIGALGERIARLEALIGAPKAPPPVPAGSAMRSWAPVLGFAVLLVFQMVSLQQQIGELRTDLHREIGDL